VRKPLLDGGARNALLGISNSVMLAEITANAGSNRSVGASLLAMEANDDAGNQTCRGVLWFFASRLAPARAGM
jgi:hypothetical protein